MSILAFGYPGSLIAAIVVISGLLALIPAKIAKDKGYHAGAFWLFGFVTFFLALVVALIIHPKPPSAWLPPGPPRVCSFCAEPIQPAAIVCRHCGREQATVPCPRCEEQMPAGAGVQCPSCNARPTLTLNDGRWWFRNRDGASRYLDPTSNRWVSSPTGRP